MSRPTLEDLLARCGVQEAEYRDGRKVYRCDYCGQRAPVVIVVSDQGRAGSTRRERQACTDCVEGRGLRPLGRDWRTREGAEG